MARIWYGVVSAMSPMGRSPPRALRIKERPSIYAIESVKKGEVFTDRNIRIIRPANGLAPKYFGAVVGRTCARDIAAGAPLSWEFIEGGAPAADKPARES